MNVYSVVVDHFVRLGVSPWDNPYFRGKPEIIRVTHSTPLVSSASTRLFKTIPQGGQAIYHLLNLLLRGKLVVFFS